MYCSVSSNCNLFSIASIDIVISHLVSLNRGFIASAIMFGMERKMGTMYAKPIRRWQRPIVQWTLWKCITTNHQTTRQILRKMFVVLMNMLKLAWNQTNTAQLHEYLSELLIYVHRYSWIQYGMYSTIRSMSARLIASRMQFMGERIVSFWPNTTKLDILNIMPKQHTVRLK